MENTRIYRFLRNHLNDDYELDVLYFHIKRLACQHKFSFKNRKGFQISKRYFKDDVQFDLSKIDSSVDGTLCLLMSIRAIILDRDLLKTCIDDKLLFHPEISARLSWIDYIDIFRRNADDNDLQNLLVLLKSYRDNGCIQEKHIQKFLAEGDIPEQKNLNNYYREISESPEPIVGEVICNNAFLCDDTIVEYNVPEIIKYIGDTSFAYCINLKSVRINSDDIMFGQFPFIECPNLKFIIVPESSVDYYKNELPYYADKVYTDSTLPEDDEKFKKIYNVFDKKATSYKYFWFWSILDIIKEEGTIFIPFKDIVCRMVSIAWPLINDSGLSFGVMDQIGKISKNLIELTPLYKSSTSDEVNRYLQDCYDGKNQVSELITPLLKNVPYRFLSPWIQYTSDIDVVAKSNSEEYNAPYGLDIEEQAIVLDEDWLDYFIDKNDKMHLLVKSSLTEYLKLYNEEKSISINNC